MLKLIVRILGMLIKLCVALVAIAIPLLGGWVGSSLAAFLNGPRWVAPVVALLAFPIVPLLWDGWARRKKQKDAKQILTFVDRMILRTLTLNIIFLSAFFFFGPKTVFTAMSARGDWMLDDSGDNSAVTSVRTTLFSMVDGLEWAFGETVSDNVYEDLVDEDDLAPPPDLHDSIDDRDASDIQPAPDDPRPDGPRDPDAPDAPDAPDTPNAPDTPRTPPAIDETWPFDPSPHSALATLPPSAELSISALANYITSVEENEVQRIKALHDWVAAHIQYDVAVLRAIERGEFRGASSQEAETVFRTRIGVCAGYANLMKALGDAADIEIEVVVGHTRHSADVGGVGHAWNAVRVADRWYLMDATWDAGYVDGETFTASYSADYFLTPAGAFGRNHLPDNPEWQLLAQPITRAEFMRLPNLRPSFFEHGLALETPNRSQVTVSGDLQVRLNNPQREWVIVSIQPKEGGDGERVQCGMSNSVALSAQCPIENSGFYTLHFFLGEEQYGSYQGVGEIEVVRR